MDLTSHSPEMVVLEELMNSQLTNVPPVPTHDFSNKVIIVTGANTGLGLEAARHLVRLNAKVILTARTIEKGDAAKAEIEASTGKKGVIEVYTLELSSYKSVERFAEKISSLPRVDGLLANAGMLSTKFELLEGDESTMTVNVISTCLLAFMLLPALRRSAETFHIIPNVTFICSGTHVIAKFPEWKSDNIFDSLSDEKTADLSNRYPLSKLILLLITRELAQRMTPSPKITANIILPGLCHSSLDRDVQGPQRRAIDERKAKYARTTEEGGRTLVYGIAAGLESHGKLMSNCEVSDAAMSPFVNTEDGAKAQKKVWEELAQKLEGIRPGIMAGI